MKNIDRQTLEKSRPCESLSMTAEFCLDRLYQDRQHCLENSVVEGLTFEELIGCLLLARDRVELS